jgi:hypothetical protein
LTPDVCRGRRARRVLADARQYAEELGLDADRLWDELRRRTHAERFAEDIGSAEASGGARTRALLEREAA